MRNLHVIDPREEQLCSSRTISVLGYPGGKYHLAKNLVHIFEGVAKQFNLNIYAETCAGAGRVMLNLDKSVFSRRIWSDLDYPLLCFFYCLSDEEYTRELIYRLTRIDCDRYTFKEAVAARKHLNDLASQGVLDQDYVSAAVHTYLTSKLSYAGGLNSYIPLKSTYRYYQKVDELTKFTPTLKGVEFYRKDCRKFFREIESGQAGIDPNRVLLYQDLPYPPCSMRSSDHYRFSLSDNDHIDIADQVKDTKVHLVISSFDCWIYDELVKNYGWDKVFIKRKFTSMAGRGGDEYYDDEYIYTSFKVPQELR